MSLDASDGWDRTELERAGALARDVRARVGADAPLFAVRAPGRVNLIGEHTDYSGLPVLPVAIDRSTVVVAAARGREIMILNSNPVYGAREFAIAVKIPPFPRGDWANYVKAALQGVIDRFAPSAVLVEKLHGAMIAIDGEVPVASGLSSSAALTVCCALAFMAVNDLRLTPLETAAMVARSEWYVGTMAGGMDQAASCLGRRDHALFIEFNPLKVRTVGMPREAKLVVADTLEIADKSGRVRDEYNRRVVECSIAAQILARALGIGKAKILGDVVRALRKWSSGDLIATLAAAAPEKISPDLHDAARILGIDRGMLAAELLGSGSLRVSLNASEPLEILARARHVLTETERVIRAAEVLEAGNLDEMGALMNASHASLKRDFGCSTPRLDELVLAARRGGALGARLTGAGFGGSIVALCRAGEEARVIESMKREYYDRRGLIFDDACAVLRAGAGASTVRLASA